MLIPPNLLAPGGEKENKKANGRLMQTKAKELMELPNYLPVPFFNFFF